MTAIRDWPLPAAIVLGVLATGESLSRAGEAGTAAVVIGLAATVPLAFATRHAAGAALVIAPATALTSLCFRGFPAVTGLLALAAVCSVLARTHVGQLRAGRAEQHAMQDSLRELTVRGARSRIAWELHDVVAHRISLISARAESARLSTPEQATAGLHVIGETARTALMELRRVQELLRPDAGHEPIRPYTGLGQMLELVDGARETSGADARLIVHGTVTGLDPGVELAACRIVEESLAGTDGCPVAVELDYTGDDLRVRISDAGPLSPDGPELLGMRERAATVGGELRTTPAPGTGLAVEARLPVA
ncbi:sensor histidine kinase [Amycolatopsis acidicola]|uniref:histidine kinase n=1 Tax=Amycolatopsis acidicola TaxID=2596893 RepID=A0A5N0UTD6_9PSEU|nr:histidine kinase [Amycolatopsis acidicola]KAA9153182.1 sensor histidine kinase [Amycolatopsis acidicola]